MSKREESQQETIFNLLKQERINWSQVLSEVLACFDCTTGTIHFLDRNTSLLMLECQNGVPDFLLPKLSEIPIGKGMAGIAAERMQAVEMCNLQTDTSGIARPAAKETKVEGSVAVPMMLNEKLYGVLGIAKRVAYDFTKEEVRDLLIIGEKMSKRIDVNN